MDFPTEADMQAAASSSRRHNNSKEVLQFRRRDVHKLHFPTSVPLTRAKAWMLVMDQQLKIKAASSAAAAFKEEHDDLP